MYRAKSRLSNLKEDRFFKALFSFLTTPLVLLVGTGAAIAL